MFVDKVFGVRGASARDVAGFVERSAGLAPSPRRSSYLGSYWTVALGGGELQICDWILPDGEPLYDLPETYDVAIRAYGNVPERVDAIIESWSIHFELLDVESG
ncbi:hypothetical protein G5C66_15090 [Nocardioides sp. KC13]|uniref:Uncharacterized protein n=1 Tax=Nocardioides turkmenicus TaxID=2711220 RepID=A0A6M1R2W6_9ACTN|nr:hypothetical protein [Nocardioides sp. KC13]NGN94062.1 hypothetical protein [Nocardioides sp. KC13]